MGDKSTRKPKEAEIESWVEQSETQPTIAVIVTGVTCQCVISCFTFKKAYR
jgi:amino acid transporter